MRFITHKITTNSSGSFQKLIEKVAAANAKQIKTASAEEESEVKTAQTAEATNDDNEIRKDKHWVEGSPSDDNGEAEEDGEKLTVEPAGLDSGKETMCKADGKTKVAEEETEVKKAKAGEDEEEEIVEAASDEEESKEKEASTKVAGCNCCEDCGTDKCSCEDCKQACKAEAESETKVASDEGESGPAKGEGPGDDSEDIEGKNEGRFPEPDRESSKCYTQEADDDGKADVESSTKEEVRLAIRAARSGNVSKLANLSPAGRSLAKVAFEKVGNLKPKSKAWLKNYYRMVWPEDFADAMVQDK